MKTPAYIISSLRVSLVFVLVLFLGSCQKTEKMQTFDDIFNTKGVDEFNGLLAVAKTVNDLPAEFGTAKIAVPEGIKNISPERIAAWYSKNIKLSDAEVDLLLKNDSKTYIDVINRIASFPPEMGVFKAEDFKELKNSDLNQYLLKQKDQPENFYSTDYYSAILALQDYVKVAVIEPINAVAKISGVTASSDILYYKLIVSNNIWDMWWTYYYDGTRTKHKGAAGSFPG